MKILVTGSSGFIGSHLMEELDNAVGYDLKNRQDIRNPRLDRYLGDIDVVVHLAAQTSIANCWKNPVDLYSHNVLGTANVIQCAVKAGVKKILYASSASVYNPSANPYAISKFMNEALFETHKNQIQSIGMRFMNVYGKGQNKSYGTVIPAFYEGIKSGKGITVYGDGEQTRDFIHVSDIVRFIKTAADDKPLVMNHTVLDVGTGVSVSVNTLADKFQELMGKTTITHIKGRSEVKESKANIEKQLAFGFSPKITLDEGLRKVVSEGI